MLAANAPKDPPDPPTAPQRGPIKRVLLIGWDGADPALATRWMDEGQLPALAALRARGCFRPLRSTRPPVTYPAWTTCVTGVHPGRHGIFDFTQMDPGAYRIRFVNSTYRRVPALWNRLSAHRRRCCVLGVPGTYPPEPINGIMLSGFDSPVATRVDPSCVHPPVCYDKVRDWCFADLDESNIREGWHDKALAALLHRLDDKERIACDLLADEAWDFFMVVFGEADTASHHFWLFHDPDSPRHRKGPADAIRRIYQRLDQITARLIETAGPDTLIMVLSDHGFTGAGDGVLHLNNWLAQEGYLRFAGNPRGSLLKTLALRTVPAAWRGTLFRRLRPWAESAESSSRFSGIDWKHTRAWSEELNYFPSIRVNLRGREARGIVHPEDYDAFVAALCARLETSEHIAHAWPRAALYSGPCIAQAPDIILELASNDGYPPACLRSRGGPPFRRLRPDEFLGGKERGMTGVHRDPGILCMSERTAFTNPGLEDITPTVLARLGVPAPPLDGIPLLGAGPRTATDDATPPDTAAPYPRAAEAILEARLRDLGYFE